MRVGTALGTRIGAALVALVLACVGTIAWLHWHVRRDAALLPIADIGGPFALVDHQGRHVTERDYLGNPSLVFFGFTNCPDVCPTTLLGLTDRLKELGSRADQLNVLFITVDPARDTPDQLALYLSSFDPHITGLSGSERDIGAVMKRYRVFARKIPLKDGGYTMDHTATIYMMNRHWQFVGTMSYQEPETAARAKLRRLLDDPAAS